MGKSFGVVLSQAPRLKGSSIPAVFERLISHLETPQGLTTEGLFRVSGNATMVKQLISELDSGKDVDFFKYEYTTVAETLKRYFGELPEPIVPPMIDQQVKTLFEGGLRRPAEEILPEMKFAVDALSEINFAVLERLSKMLSMVVRHSDVNKMSLPNVVVCIAPTMRFTPAILTYCIVHHKYFFDTSNPPPEELQLLAESAPTVGLDSSPSSSWNSFTSSSFGSGRISAFRKRAVSHEDMPSSNSNVSITKTLDETALREKIQAKEEIIKEKQKLREDVAKERKQLKIEFEAERQVLLEAVMGEKESMKSELQKEKEMLKEIYSKEKRMYKDELSKMRKELDMAKTVIQTLKDKIDTFAEVNYELERKLKKQQLRNKALQLDIEGLHRKLVKQNLSDSQKARSLSPSIQSPTLLDSPKSDDLLMPKRNEGREDDDESGGERRRSDEGKKSERSKSRTKRRSTTYPKSGSSSHIEEAKGALLEHHSSTKRDKREKTKELLKKNTTRLMEAHLYSVSTPTSPTSPLSPSSLTSFSPVTTASSKRRSLYQSLHGLGSDPEVGSPSLSS